MCLAVPARVQAIEGEVGIVDLDGVEVEVSLLMTPDAKIGDHVVIHVGYALAVIDPQEAEAALLALDAAIGESALA